MENRLVAVKGQKESLVVMVQFTELIQISSATYAFMNVCVPMCVSLYVCSCM